MPKQIDRIRVYWHRCSIRAKLCISLTWWTIASPFCTGTPAAAFSYGVGTDCGGITIVPAKPQISEVELRDAIRSHKAWLIERALEYRQFLNRDKTRDDKPIALSTGIITGIRLDLSKSFLARRDFSEMMLAESRFEGAQLTWTNFSRSNLTDSSMSGARLYEAVLEEAHLASADLEEACLSAAKLTRADLEEARLKKVRARFADFHRANLSEADMEEADLEGSSLREATLAKVRLDGANLSRADFSEARLDDATLIGANAKDSVWHRADLSGADLSGVDFRGANLQQASLTNTNLTSANLTDSRLDGVRFKGASVKGVIFEPVPASLSDAKDFLGIENLESVVFVQTAEALLTLKDLLHRAGLDDLEKQVIVAIRRSKRMGKPPLMRFIEWAFIDVTCEYGRSPNRPLLLLFAIVGLFAVPYYLAMGPTNNAQIYWVTLEGKPGAKNFGSPISSWIRVLTSRLGVSVVADGFLRVSAAIYFSLHAAFQIGWQGFSISEWLSRLHSGESQFRATGWARGLAGVQSIVSLYLFGLWLVVMWGNPFG